MKDLWHLILFFGLQYLLGRRGSYPYGLLVGFSLFKITLLVVVSDMVQTLILLNLFDWLAQKIPWLKKKRNGYVSGKSKNQKRNWLSRLKKYQAVAVIAIAGLPYGGGALTGSIFSISLKLSKKKAFLFIMIGCIIGSMLFYLAFAGIMTLLPPK